MALKPFSDSRSTRQIFPCLCVLWIVLFLHGMSQVLILLVLSKRRYYCEDRSSRVKHKQSPLSSDLVIYCISSPVSRKPRLNFCPVRWFTYLSCSIPRMLKDILRDTLMSGIQCTDTLLRKQLLCIIAKIRRLFQSF